MNRFAWAMKQMQDGKRVARAEWNGNGVLFLIPGWRAQVNRATLLDVDMKTPGGAVIPWISSPADMVAADWKLADD